MKSWQVVLLVSAVVLVGVVVLMKAQQPKATPVNTSFGAPAGTAIGLASAALPSIINLFKSSGNPASYTREGTYRDDITPVEGKGGYTLVDPNTGSTLVYGTD